MAVSLARLLNVVLLVQAAAVICWNVCAILLKPGCGSIQSTVMPSRTPRTVFLPAYQPSGDMRHSISKTRSRRRFG